MWPRGGTLYVVVLCALFLASCRDQPSAPRPGATSIVRGRVTVETWDKSIDRVFFDFDSAVVKPDAAPLLKSIAIRLAQYPNVTITVEGFTDDRGSRPYNLALGQKRAEAAKAALVAVGVSAARIKTISYGKDRPFIVNPPATLLAASRAMSRCAIYVVD